MKLYAFTVSHFSEKARWALDHKEIEYEYQALVPGPHILTTRRLKLPHTWVPIFEDSHGVVQGSSEIITYIDQRFPHDSLTPPEAGVREEVLEWERALNQQVGDDLRRILYDVLLRYPKTLMPLWTQGTPWWSKPTVRLLYGRLELNVRKLYRIKPDRVEQSKASFDAMMERLERRLSAHPFLVGESLTRADITAAALLAPAVQPHQHPCKWPEEIPEELSDFAARYRDSATWKWVEDLYNVRR